jgi:hypothetical protein
MKYVVICSQKFLSIVYAIVESDLSMSLQGSRVHIQSPFWSIQRAESWSLI